MKPVLLSLIISLLLVACGGNDAVVTAPTPTEEPPTATIKASPTTAATSTAKASNTPKATKTAKASSTPKATKTPKASSTPKATKTPKASKTPKATKTAKATSTPKATPTPSATATPAFPDYIANPPFRQGSPERESVQGRKSYPPGSYEFIHNQFSVPQPPGYVPDEYLALLPRVPNGICPLTGERGSSELINRRPLNVRLDNSPQGRPQAGLENADVVWEALAEGGFTRLTATYHCNNPGTIGPIRSARLIDLQLTPMLQAWLVHAGSAQPVTDMIWASLYADRSINEWASDPAFYRIDQAPVGWLRTYSNNNLLLSEIANRGDAAPPSTLATLPQPIRGWLFSNAIPQGASGEASQLSIPYAAGFVSYTYDSNRGRYWRYQGNNVAHTTQSGAQIGPHNVLVIFSEMSYSTIVEDSLGSVSLHFDLQGEGPALLLRNGKIWETRWIREGENTLIRIVDEENKVIPLAIGRSWVQVVPSTMDVTWE